MISRAWHCITMHDVQSKDCPSQSGSMPPGPRVLFCDHVLDVRRAHSTTMSSVRMFVGGNTPQPEDACGMRRGSIRFGVVQREMWDAGDCWRALESLRSAFAATTLGIVMGGHIHSLCRVYREIADAEVMWPCYPCCLSLQLDPSHRLLAYKEGNKRRQHTD